MIFSVVCGFSRPGLHIWRSGANVRRHLRPLNEQADAEGWHHFECELDPCLEAEVGFKLYQRAESNDGPEDWEDSAFNRLLPRSGDGGFPAQVWCAQGSARVLVEDPRAASPDGVQRDLIALAREAATLLLPEASAAEVVIEVVGSEDLSTVIITGGFRLMPPETISVVSAIP